MVANALLAAAVRPLGFAAMDLHAPRMHADEIDIDAALARRLLAGQFPEWASLPLERVSSTGTDNAIFRLGDDLAMRLPRYPAAIEPLERERLWLPRLAPRLPLAIPLPVAQGMPGEGYPWHWSVYHWLAGESATLDSLADPVQAAPDLARFLIALHRADPADAPLARHAVPLTERDADTRAAIRQLDGTIDVPAVTAAWESALAAPIWDRPPVWVHGDMLPGNVLVHDGEIRAVIDFGIAGVGDPACDLTIAWSLFEGPSRDAFRAATRADDATWARGRGHALSWALIFAPYYVETNPLAVRTAFRTIAEVLADHA